MKLRALVVTCAMLLVTVAASAQPSESEPTGCLQGTILDAENQKPLPFANVAFFHVREERYPDGFEAGGTMSRKDGRFSRTVAPGKYRVVGRYVSYERAEVREVVVRAGETTEVSLVLARAPIKTKTVVVQGARVRDKESALLANRQKADRVTDAISSEQIAKSTDGNAAEALGRVTGLSVVDGRYVYVRGLGERYSSTEVNGASIGTPEPNKRVVPLDLFPSGLLDNILVQKTYTPDMEGEFGGGVISVQTKSFPDRNLTTQSLSVGMAPAGDTQIGYAGGDTDWLGFDDGTRRLPGLIGARTSADPIRKTTVPLDELKAMARSFNNVWTPRDAKARPDFRYALLQAVKFEAFGLPVGISNSLTLGRSYETVERQESVYEGDVVLSPRQSYSKHQSTASTLGGLTSNVSLRLKDDYDVKLNVVYTRSTDDKTSIASGENNDLGNVARITQLVYRERGLLSAVLSGNRALSVKGSKLEWNASYSRAGMNEPDRREAIYEQDNEGQFQLSRRFSYPLTRIYGNSEEYNRAVKGSWAMPLFTGSQVSSGIKFGMSFRDRNRNSAYRRFGFTTRYASRPIDRRQNPEGLLEQENLEHQDFVLEEATNDNDSYFAEQQVAAVFAMHDFKLAEKLHLVAGARLEQASTRVLAASPHTVAATPPQLIARDEQDVLPAYNLTWTPARRMNVRLGYSMTLARPEFRELSPFSMYNFETGYEESGDTTLVTTHLRNYDVRWEYFGKHQELLAVSVFRKKFDRPIERVVAGGTGSYREAPQNGLDGDLSGYELELRAPLSSALRVARVGSSPFFDRVGLMANYSRVHSEARVELASGTKSAPLRGQADRTLNLGLFWGSKRLDAAVLYKSFGMRLSSFGLGLPDIYEHPMSSLDVTFGCQLARRMRLKASAENLGNSSVEFRQGALVTQHWSPGRKLGLAVQYSLGRQDG